MNVPGKSKGYKGYNGVVRKAGKSSASAVGKGVKRVTPKSSGARPKNIGVSIGAKVQSPKIGG